MVFCFLSDKAGTESSSVKDETLQLETSGYYYNDLWRPLSGITLRQFNDSSAITQCLRNKVINMYGDSTARQWFEYLIAFAPGKVHLHLFFLQPLEYNWIAEISILKYCIFFTVCNRKRFWLSWYSITNP